MTTNRAWLALACILVFGVVTVPLIHYHALLFDVQRACMKVGGSWETREYSNEIGCRFRAEAPTPKGNK